jgi:hypothetical protein
MAQIKFFRGTRANYNTDSQGTKQTEVLNGIYFITDEHCIMMNGRQYGGVDNEMFKGFIKDVDVESNVLSFKKDVDGTWTDVSIKLLEAADNSIVLGTIKNGEVSDGSTIKVNVKAVGDADGLKLGADGLYVDLTKTTKSITDETARATQAEEANKTAIEQEKNDRIAAINGLNAEIKGGDGKFIQSVKEENGVIAAVEADLTAAAVAYDKTADKVIANATNVSAAIKELDAKVAANKDAELTYQAVKLTAEEVTAIGDANVKEAYKVVSVNKEGTKTTVGDIIKIYKDSSLKSIDYVKENDKKKAGQFLKYVYTLADGKEQTVYVDMSELVDQAEVENGIQAVGGKLSIKLADGNEADFLTVDANGLKLSGVQTAIDTAKNEVQGKLDAEITRATQAEEANKTAIGVNAAAIAKLNGDEATTGSVAKAVADAKAELLGDAAEYNTLGKLEDKIQALDVKATKAHTEVVAAKSNSHVTVAVADSTDKTHKVVTIGENDIASATALTTEVNRAKAAEDKIEASVGLAANGSHVSSQGHYTNSATTVVGEIAALDSQVYTNTGAIATVKGIAEKNKQDIATINGKLAVASSVTVQGSTNITVTPSTEGSDNHKVFTVEAKNLVTTAQHDELATRVTNTENSISTLNGAANVTGSVDNKIDVALSWIEGGTY